MLQPRRPLVGLVARCARTSRLGPRSPEPQQAPAAVGGRRGLLDLLARQCSCVTGQRARRARRAWCRGGNGAGDGAAERARRGGAGGGGGGWWWWWWWRGPPRGRPAFAATGRLMATLAGVFVWDGQRIEEEELQRWVSAGPPHPPPRPGGPGQPLPPLSVAPVAPNSPPRALRPGVPSRGVPTKISRDCPPKSPVTGGTPVCCPGGPPLKSSPPQGAPLNLLGAPLGEAPPSPSFGGVPYPPSSSPPPPGLWGCPPHLGVPPTPWVLRKWVPPLH